MRLTPTVRIRGRAIALGLYRQLLFIALTLGLLGGLLILPGETWARGGPAQPRVAVVYPDLGEPYGSVFVAIIKGIREGLDAPLILVPLRNETAEGLQARLIAARVEVCIGLGRTTLDLLDAANLDIPVVRGAVLDPDVRTGNSGTALGISLSPDPALLLEHLKRVAPRISRVSVVYTDVRGQPLIDRARRAGERLGLDILSYKAEDLLSAAAIYKSIVPRLGGGDALWIPQDPQAVDDKVILPMLLNTAWDQDYVLFSSNADHAKRGVLFSVYPDNVGMGRRLAEIALQRAAGEPAEAGMRPLEDLLVGVNLRAAEHLRLNLSTEQMRSFDLTFPQR